MSIDAMADPRPQYRVAVFGLASRLQHLLEVVLRHARHNRYRYSLSTTRGPGDFDVALVDMTVAGGVDTARTLEQIFDERAVLRVGRRCDAARPRDDLLQSSFVGQVLYALNRVVDARRSRERAEREAAAVDAGRVVTEDGVRRRPRALIVDDSPTVRRQLSLALNRIGLDGEAVASASEALDVLAMRSYELMLADVVMPGLDGYQLTRTVRRDRALRAMPVILLTSRSSPFDLARGALAGCNSYLVKPVSMQTLHETVQRQLRRYAKRRRMENELRFAA
ncbi:MAG: response regulator [Burkholderiaceae bacterium]|nr:response regulator [Burkholderiaceae bacterium]